MAIHNVARLLGAAVALAMSLTAQSDTASLFGTIRDQSSAVIVGARVHLKSIRTTAVREQLTSAKGVYHFDRLPPGDYVLTVEAQGFRQFKDSAVQLQVAQVSRLNVQMEIGSTSEAVEVDGSVSPLVTDSAANGTVIGERKILQLPLNGRQFMQLALLVPGASTGGRQVQQNQVRMGQMGGLSIAGGRTNNTAFLLDGAANTDPDFSSLNYSPQIDGVAEFQVQTAMVGAEYGRATINIASKSGSNEFHGTAFEFLRNKTIDARPFNAPSDLPKFQRNQFGGTFGGAVRKDKGFAFLAYEGLAVRQAGAGLTTVTVPSQRQRRADFGATPGGIFDPATLSGGVRQPFPNNQIPANRIDPIAMAAVQALPLPTNPGPSTFENSGGILRQDNHNYSARGDWNISSGWTTFGRYSASEEDALIPAVVAGRDQISDVRSQNAVYGSTVVLGSSAVNETRVSFSRLRILSGLPELSFNVDGRPTVLPAFLTAGYPTMGGSGGFQATTGGGLIQVRNNTFQIYNNLAMTKGRHSLKLGGQILELQYNRHESPNLAGTYQFTHGFTTRTARNDGTGDSLASMLLGLPAVASRTLGPSRIDGRQRQYAAYMQDDFHIRPDLTVNLGVRYEFAAPIADRHHQMASVDYRGVPSPQGVFTERRTGFYRPTLFVCGTSGYPAGCAYTDKNNVAPRVGIAWSPSKTSVLRAGAGVFYANNDANPLFRLAASLPTNIAQTLNSDNFVPRFTNFDVFGPPVVGPVQIQAAGLDLFQRTSYLLQWNFSIQRQIGRDVVIEAGYLATAGLKLEQNVQPNNAQPGSGAVDPRRPYAGLEYAPGTQFPPYLIVQGNTVPVGLINFLPHSAQSNYHSLFTRFEKRLRGSVSLLVSYTFSKAITNAPQFRNAGGVNGNENSPAQDSHNLQLERGLASFHNTHRAVTTFLYDLPIRRSLGFLHTLFGNTQLSGILSAQSGFPFTVNLRGDTAGVGAGTGGIFVRPNYVPGQTVTLSGSQRTTSRFFNTQAFSTPAAATFGNLGRNTVIGPGLVNIDFVVAKNIIVSDRFHIQLRGEFFNGLNHPNYNIVGRILNDPTHGRVLNQLDPRQIQFGLKFIF